MNPNAPVNWYVQGPSIVLAALSYLLIARLALDLAFGALQAAERSVAVIKLIREHRSVRSIRVPEIRRRILPVPNVEGVLNGQFVRCLISADEP